MHKSMYDILEPRRWFPKDIDLVSYLINYWGLSQTHAAELTGISQTKISQYNTLIGLNTFEKTQLPNYNAEHIKKLMNLTRDVLPDYCLVSFVQDVLKINVKSHAFWSRGGKPAIRQAALDHLGIKQRFIAKIFQKSHGTISLNIKRAKEQMLKSSWGARFHPTDNLSIDSEPFVTNLEKENVTEQPFYRAFNHNPYAVKEPKMPWD